MKLALDPHFPAAVPKLEIETGPKPHLIDVAADEAAAIEIEAAQIRDTGSSSSSTPSAEPATLVRVWGQAPTILRFIADDNQPVPSVRVELWTEEKNGRWQGRKVAEFHRENSEALAFALSPRIARELAATRQDVAAAQLAIDAERRRLWEALGSGHGDVN